MTLDRKILIAATLSIAGALAAPAQTVSVSVGGEAVEMQVTHCRTDAHEFGQLQVLGELTAIGTFRGQPATLLVTSSSASGGAVQSQLDLYLTEISSELHKVSSFTVLQKILQDHTDRWGKRSKDEIPQLKREDFEGLSHEEMMAKVEEHAARSVALRKEMIASKPAHARAWGTAGVASGKLEFNADSIRVIDGAEKLAGLAGSVQVSAACGP